MTCCWRRVDLDCNVLLVPVDDSLLPVNRLRQICRTVVPDESAAAVFLKSVNRSQSNVMSEIHSRLNRIDEKISAPIPSPASPPATPQPAAHPKTGR
jgi:hypothetical protein